MKSIIQNTSNATDSINLAINRFNDSNDENQRYKKGAEYIIKAIEIKSGDIDSALKLMQIQTESTNDPIVREGMQNAINIAHDFIIDVRTPETVKAISEIQYSLYEKSESRTDLYATKIEQAADKLSDFKGNDLAAFSKHLSFDSTILTKSRDSDSNEQAAEVAAGQLVSKEINNYIISAVIDPDYTMVSVTTFLAHPGQACEWSGMSN